MRSTTPRATLLAPIVLGALALAACSASPTPAPTATATESAPPAAPIETPDATPSPTAEASAPSCETLISASLVEELTSYGWTARTDDFLVGATVVEGGLQCTWADFDGPATDNLLVFGWAPVAASEATRLQSDLIAQGWLREDGPQGTYITTDPQYAVAVDEDGYGMTYLFGDGWVTVALTKQGLVLIERPDA
ncbi:hypothetical protein IT882_09835 [Microbacterium schleiferi]|uniref:Nitrate ABC transporter substrate-binding protein n=1 Tax=Microbacterium schleiferi TaxID=69362 RepID=A0A7S8RGU4_9MICO|nr:hypothetical protein [Microbacterium schleiferi]QPE03621.1 hypothetical protein IT882_09835 [Microbacterium schleiferi]